MKTYSNRRTEGQTIKEITEGGVYYEGGMAHGLFPEMKGVLQAGDMVTVETRNLSFITGVMFEGRWLFHKSDEDLEREREEFKANLKREREEWLEKNRNDLERRTAALPEWIRKRIERFRQSPGFEADGWGYELVIAELAVIYAEHGLKDSNEDYSKVEGHPVWPYVEKHGTSGNQHDFAKALARAYVEGQIKDAGGTVSGLSPITGDPFYEGGEPSDRVQGSGS